MAKKKDPRLHFTTIFVIQDPDAGEILVCIFGKFKIFLVLLLDYEFIVIQKVDGVHKQMRDATVVHHALCLSRSFYYMTDGTVVTTESQPFSTMEGAKEIWHIELPRYGVVVIEHAGAVQRDIDIFQIFVSNPKPGVYLVILIEAIGVNPLEYRPVDLMDKELCSWIIRRYLIAIGAILPDPEETNSDEPKGILPDYNEC